MNIFKIFKNTAKFTVWDKYNNKLNYQKDICYCEAIKFVAVSSLFNPSPSPPPTSSLLALEREHYGEGDFVCLRFIDPCALKPHVPTFRSTCTLPLFSVGSSCTAVGDCHGNCNRDWHCIDGECRCGFGSGGGPVGK